MKTKYETPQADAYQVDTFTMDSETIDHVFRVLRGQTTDKMLFVWNKGRIVFMCPDVEEEAEFAKELCEWLNKKYGTA